MSAGTKVFLAVFGLLVLILVIYYGVLLPGGTDAKVVFDDGNASPETVDRAPQQDPSSDASTARDRDEARTALRQPPREIVPRGSIPADPEPDADPIGRERPEDPVTNDEAEVTGEPTREVTPLSDRERESVEEAPDEDEAQPDDDNADDPDDADVEVEASEEPDEAEEPERPAAPASTPPEYTTYTVRSGDTMSSIARDWFGEPNKWDLIAKANPLVDPNRLRVGQELRLPPKNTEREEIVGDANAGNAIYTVRSGDNLSKIARAYYNDSSLWRLIFDANRETLRNDPDNIRVGMRLRIPPAPRPAEEDEG